LGRVAHPQAIDPAGKTVTMMDGDGQSRRIPYDKLVIGVDAAPVCPVATGVRPEVALAAAAGVEAGQGGATRLRQGRHCDRRQLVFFLSNWHCVLRLFDVYYFQVQPCSSLVVLVLLCPGKYVMRT
jgi:hypothetical protein